MPQTNHTLPASGAPQLLCRAMMCMAVVLMVAVGSVFTAPGEALALQASPSALSFTGTQGAADPAAQSVTLWKRGDRDNSWTASVSASWLTVSPMSGSISTERDQVNVEVNLSNLAAGNHSSNIIIIEVRPNGGTRRTVLPVSLTVLPATSIPNFSISPSGLTFSGTAGGASPASQAFTVSNTGTGTLSWTASDNTPWLTLSPSSGTNSGTVTANVTLTGLAAGTHSTTITVTATGATAKTIPVTLTLTAATLPPAIGLNPASLGFAGTVGGTNPSAQTIGVSNVGGGTLSWAAADNAAWLTLSPMSGANSGTVTANVNLTGLAAGTYSTAVTVTAPGATTKTVPVALTITAPATPVIGLSPISLTFTGTAGGTNPAAQTFAVSNTGSGTLSWAASDSAGWLVLSPMSGTNNGSVTASVNLTGLAAGTHSTTITVTATGATAKTIPVTLTLTAATASPAIGLNTTTLGFAGTVGGTNPSAQTIGVSNVGGGTLSWTASDNAAWLTLSPVSGTNSGTVTANVNVTGLAAGTYNAIITVTASGVPAKTLPVTLTITATTAGATIGFSPTSLTFTGTVGGTNPAAKPVSISNTGGGTLSWTASDNAAWLTLSPASGTNSGTVTASVNMTGLAAGTYNGIITLTASGSTNSPRQIPVSFTLSATTAGTVTLAWNAGTDSDLAGYRVYRGTASGTYGAPLATLPKTTTSHTATGLQNGTTYFFVITAYDSAGNESTYSNEVSKSIF